MLCFSAVLLALQSGYIIHFALEDNEYQINNRLITELLSAVLRGLSNVYRIND